MRNLLIKKTRYGNRGACFKDLTGKKYGMLTVIDFGGISKAGTNWITKCECGNKITRLASNLKKKHKHSCGCISKNPPKRNAGFKRFFNDYKQSALNRNYPFNLSQTKFLNLIFKNCYYCDGIPTKRYEKFVAITFFANGIDRLDNTKGYVLNNCVTCCKICNKAKSTLDEQEFKEWIIKVYRNYASK